MNKKISFVIGIIVILFFLVWGGITLLGSKLEYVDFNEAISKKKKVEVQGVYVKEKGQSFDGNIFTFYMKDKNNTEMKVIYKGPKPNNFDEADAVVVKGKVDQNNNFIADDILTKCPSKYEGKGEEFRKSIKDFNDSNLK
ncbi:MAG: cytochrome c maturation protein CcmE [Ignavibacteria bacterium]